MITWVEQNRSLWNCTTMCLFYKGKFRLIWTIWGPKRATLILVKFFSPKESSDWFEPSKVKKKATLILVKFSSHCQCNRNSKLYQPWIVCPCLPLLFQGSTLQSYEAVIKDPLMILMFTRSFVIEQYIILHYFLLFFCNLWRARTDVAWNKLLLARGFFVFFLLKKQNVRKMASTLF